MAHTEYEPTVDELVRFCFEHPVADRHGRFSWPHQRRQLRAALLAYGYIEVADLFKVPPVIGKNLPILYRCVR